jgi:hypothetical protein
VENVPRRGRLKAFSNKQYPLGTDHLIKRGIILKYIKKFKNSK